MNKRNILKIFLKNPEKKNDFKMSKLSWNIYLFFYLLYDIHKTDRSR